MHCRCLHLCDSNVEWTLQFQLLTEMDVWRIVPGCIHWILHSGTAWLHHLSPAGLLEPWLLHVGRGCTRLLARVGICHLWVWESCEPSQIMQPAGKNWLPFCSTERYRQVLNIAGSYSEVLGASFDQRLAVVTEVLCGLPQCFQAAVRIETL